MTTTLDLIRDDAAAIERALHEGLLGAAGELPDADVVAAIALVAREAHTAPGGLAALLAGDYADAPETFCARMHRALAVAARLHECAEAVTVDA